MAELDKELRDAILTKGGKPLEEEIDISVSLGDIDELNSKESLKGVFDDIKQYNRMLKEKITFINPAMSKVIPFTRENLYLMCAYTGNGKSTIAANISYPLWQEGKKVLVIANEESRSDVLFRIACLHYGYSFNEYKKGRMVQAKQQQCARILPDISKYIHVFDVNYKDGLTTRLEGVINALKAVQKEDYACCLIDYYQLIINSTKRPDMARYDALNQLRIYMQRYIKASNIPIVLFAQLHSMGKRNNVELDSRIKECPAIIEAATVVIEIVPHFEMKKTDFIIKKDRFGLQGYKLECGFEEGKFVPYDDKFKSKVKQGQIDKLAEQVEVKPVTPSKEEE